MIWIKKKQSLQPTTNAAPDSSTNKDDLDKKFISKLISSYYKGNKNNILSEKNEVLTDDIIDKLKTSINWEKVNDDIELIKIEIDKL